MGFLRGLNLFVCLIVSDSQILIPGLPKSHFAATKVLRSYEKQNGTKRESVHAGFWVSYRSHCPVVEGSAVSPVLGEPRWELSSVGFH